MPTGTVSISNKTNYQICPINYNSDDGSDSCSIYPLDSISKTNSRNCSICPEGSFSYGSQCIDCPNGQFSLEGQREYSNCQLKILVLITRQFHFHLYLNHLIHLLLNYVKRENIQKKALINVLFAKLELILKRGLVPFFIECPIGIYSGDGANSCQECSEG